MATDRLSGRKTLKVDGFLEEFEKDEIKAKVDIVLLFSHFGVTLTPKGKGFTGKCPWHQDKDPSLSVDREKGLYHCFGCGESGDAFALVEKMKGVGFREALEYLKPRVGMLPTNKPAAKAVAQKAEIAPTVEAKDEHPEITLTTVAEHYHKRFCESSAARSYLEKRGIKSPELMRRFQIGYADGTILSMVSNGQKGKLKDLGILTESGRELFTGSLTFPIVDEAGHSVGLYARSIGENAKLKHLYLPGRHHGVFNRKASKAFNEIILTEGIIDALSLIALGLENAQACYGVHGFTEEHLEMLRQDRVKTVILAFDNDEPGQKASEELAGKLVAEGFSVIRVFPGAKDWNEDLLAGVEAAAIRAKITEAALVAPESLHEALDVRREGSRFQFTMGGVSYRLWSAREMFTTNLRVSMRAECKGECFYDNLDLYSARSRTAYSQNLAALFAMEPRRIEKDLLSILEYLEAERDKRLSSADVAPVRHELSRMVAIKDEKTGKMASHTLTSQVIVSAIMSSTSHDINPENASRCFLVNADESGEQTARIHASQREKYSLSRYFDRLHSVPRIIARHHAAQRLLRPLLIVNPFAEHLDFPRSLIRTRRDHERFVDLIACVCFLRQYQKESKRSRDPKSAGEVEYVEYDTEDYKIAYTIMTGSVMFFHLCRYPAGHGGLL